MSPNRRLNVDLVIPVYDEEGVIEQTYTRLCAVINKLPDKFHIHFVDDGSRDKTAETLQRLAKEDARVSILTLSRNFGHQAALTAGMNAAHGDALITLDGDGQHPPEMIPQMLDLIRQGIDIVQTRRVDEAQPASFKKWASNLFYHLMNAISGTPIVPGSADFRALSSDAAQAIKSMPEYHRFLRGMVAWIGFPMVILPYHPGERLSGITKYSFKKRISLALDAIFSFSLVPLYIGLSLGGLLLCLALLEMIYVLSFWVTGRTSNLAPGWSSLMFVILIVGGMLMALLGFIGIYVGYIFQEVKRRPVYIIKGEQGRHGE